jgi:hypothetical protein
VALLLLLLTRHTRAQRRRREMTGRASDGSDSYSYIRSVASCCRGMRERRGGAAITEASEA